MTNSTASRGTPPAGMEPTAEKISDAMQQGLSTMMDVTQKMMQANLEAMTETIDFANRRMKAQAAMWSGVGQLGSAGSFNQLPQYFIQSIAHEMADEVKECGDLASKTMARITQLVGSPVQSFITGKSS